MVLRQNTREFCFKPIVNYELRITEKMNFLVLHNYTIAESKKTNVQLCNCVVSRGFISTTNDKMQKKSEMFFCFCRRPTTKRLQKGFCNCASRSFSTESKKQKCPRWGRNWRRNETLNLMQLGEIDVIGSACDIDHDTSRRSGRNSANCRSGR